MTKLPRPAPASLSKMKSPLNILHLEDDPDDAKLVQSTLVREGVSCAIKWVKTREDFVWALESGGIDLILSDFALPAFDGLCVAELVRTKWPIIPLILVCGSLSEILAIDSFKSGATDCVSKSDLYRLAPAVRRTMREVEERAERRRLEAQVIESQKMEVICQLSSGVAHDFNNILSVIIGYSDLITADLSPDSPLRKYAEEIRHASKRAAGLTRQLLVFSRKQLVQTNLIDPNEAVKDLEILLRRLIDEKIEILIVLGKQIGLVKADAGHIGQLLLNLVLNARDAMPRGGKLSIGTEEVTLGENDARADKMTGKYVALIVSDTGTGMTKEVKAHLFEAFFTTKPYGTGLGLATCRTIVQQSGGYIDVDSEVGKGTTFRIYLPRVERPLVNESKLDQTRRLPPGTETSPTPGDLSPTLSASAHRILLVEDDISIRELTTEMLVRFGYGVDGAPDGEAGWKALQAKRYDLLITDNLMPKVTGIEMVKKLHAAGMQLPVIMATAILPEEEFILHPWLRTVPTLLKPFRAGELLSTVRKLLPVSDGVRAAF
jgi:two-component system cell cycle sensor histidine kinase/response regulator CckA